MVKGDARQTARHWGDERRARFYAAGGLMWTELQAVRRRLNAKVSGQASVDWIDHLKATHLRGRTPVSRCLSLCCGRGDTERELVARDVCEQCLAYDVSAGALEEARALAAEQGYTQIEYVVQDVNSMELPPNHFDLVVCRMALHHVSALERVAEQINRALKPDGLLVALDYVGPSRFQYPGRQRQICNSALRLLPERFRHSISWQRHGRVGPGAQRSLAAWVRLALAKLRSGTLLGAVRRRVLHAWLRATRQVHIKAEIAPTRGGEIAVDDPSEAVRSSEISSVLGSTLDVLESKPLGGTLLMPVLDDIAANFEGDDPEASALLEMLFVIEDGLMSAGEIGSDLAFIVAAKRE